MLSEYLKSRYKIIFLMVGFICIFASSYLLFDMPLITVLYPFILCIVVLVIVGIIDFILMMKKHQRLRQEIENESLQDTGMKQPQKPDTLIEEDYQKIIDKLREEEKLSRQKSSSDYNDMVEYYTVWAHQIKTPIASMRLKLQSEDSDTSRRLEGDLNRIESYVEMVLTFIRLGSDNTDYVIKEHSLDDIIRPAIRKFSKDFISKKLYMDFTQTDYTVLSDEKWLLFVIEQVISNSVKYTKEGGVKIYMEEPGILCVEDTGIGISSEDLPRIFENGYTGFNGREDKRASGIGLYLCRRICDNLGHKISAESKQGVGTKIILDIQTKSLGIE